MPLSFTMIFLLIVKGIAWCNVYRKDELYLELVLNIKDNQWRVNITLKWAEEMLRVLVQTALEVDLISIPRTYIGQFPTICRLLFWGIKWLCGLCMHLHACAYIHKQIHNKDKANLHNFALQNWHWETENVAELIESLPSMHATRDIMLTTTRTGQNSTCP